MKNETSAKKTKDQVARKIKLTVSLASSFNKHIESLVLPRKQPSLKKLNGIHALLAHVSHKAM